MEGTVAPGGLCAVHQILYWFFFFSRSLPLPLYLSLLWLYMYIAGRFICVCFCSCCKICFIGLIDLKYVEDCIHCALALPGCLSGAVMIYLLLFLFKRVKNIAWKAETSKISVWKTIKTECCRLRNEIGPRPITELLTILFKRQTQIQVFSLLYARDGVSQWFTSDAKSTNKNTHYLISNKDLSPEFSWDVCRQTSCHRPSQDKWQ